ncbi:MAG TPA: hypothetical protein VKG38_10065 [Solirubrobacteraceae bacterium]|nr:hypothetical protein [Solirubrobacteraceae bacterium]
MTHRDRVVAIVVATLAVLVAGWLLLVSPEREKASKLGTEVSAAQSALSAAEGELSSARTAQAQYVSAYASIVGLGKAVPAADEVPSLIYQLERASNSKNVEFTSIVSSAAGSGTGSSSAGSSATSAAAGAASSAGFSQMPFTFIFDGTYFDLEHLFEQLNRFTLRTASGSLQVSGRLLTIQSVKLTPVGTAAGSSGPVQLTGTITATAYVLPASQGLTAGASPSSPAGATATASARGSSAPATPAVVEVTP